MKLHASSASSVSHDPSSPSSPSRLNVPLMFKKGFIYLFIYLFR